MARNTWNVCKKYSLQRNVCGFGPCLTNDILVYISQAKYYVLLFAEPCPSLYAIAPAKTNYSL